MSIMLAKPLATQATEVTKGCIVSQQAPLLDNSVFGILEAGPSADRGRIVSLIAAPPAGRMSVGKVTAGLYVDGSVPDDEIRIVTPDGSVAIVTLNAR